MSDQNGWPERPGYPKNADENGWHIIDRGCHYWMAHPERWMRFGQHETTPESMARWCIDHDASYVGPVFSPKPDMNGSVTLIPTEQMERIKTLLSLITVGQVIDAGPAAIDASGLNPWCLNEGRGRREDRLNLWWV